ncbi:MAG: integral rane protein [Rhodocyclaceae bacterium]|nr:integral rane protein [Rhodocyclaceae bacterium]
MTYIVLKTLHILSMVLLFGTGLGSAFYKWMADRSGDVGHIAITNRHVVLADWIFTTPTVLFQPISGFWMVHLLDLPVTTPWIAASLFLYVLAGICWLPVVWLQIRMERAAAAAVSQGTPLPPIYWRMARWWFWLGVPAFTAMVLVVALMVFKHIPGVGS